MALLGPVVQLQALFHDAEEAYTQDIPSPLKHRLWIQPQPGDGVVVGDLVPYATFEAALREQIFAKMGIPWPISPAVHAEDKTAYYKEIPIIRGGHKCEHVTDPDSVAQVFISLASVLSGTLGITLP